MDVPQRVVFKLCMTVYKCLHGLALKYLAELCVPVADVAGCRQLRSASRGLLNFTRYNVSNYGRLAFCFAGLYVWNSLPEHIRQSASTNSCLLALTKDISTSADIAPSVSETIVFYCFMGYISALTYCSLLIIMWIGVLKPNAQNV